MSRTATLSAAATVTEVNKDQLITNNSTVDIVVIDAGGKDTGGVDPVPMLTIYEQDLAILPTKDNQKFIKAGAAGTVTLNDTYTDADDPTPTYSTSYELIIASAACLYPVKSTHAKYILKSKTYTPIVVAADDATNMKAAENFQQTLMAYPSSTMAKDFANALNAAGDTGTSADDIDAKVNAFFAGTKGFQNVTLNMITAFTTYYNQYPYVWAGYQGSKTYYLYTSDGNVVNSMGSVQIKVPTAIPADTDKSLKGYTLTYTDATGASSPLYYVKGQFVNDIKADIPSICLVGTFTVKSTLTKVDADTMTISILTGTIHGKNVLGYDQQQKQNDDGSWSGLYTILHPKDLMGWITLFMTATGLFMGLEMIYKGLKGLKDRFTKKKARNNDEDPNSTELEDMRGKYKSDRTQMQEDYQKLMDKMDKSIDVTQDLATKMEEFQKKVTDQLNEDQRSNYEDHLETASDTAQSMLDYGNPPSLKKLNKEIGDNYNKIDGASTAELPGVLPEVQKGVYDININIKVEITRVKATADAETQKELDNAQDAMDQAEKTSEKIEEDKTDTENGDTPEDMDFQPHEFQPGIFD